MCVQGEDCCRNETEGLVSWDLDGRASCHAFFQSFVQQLTLFVCRTERNWGGVEMEKERKKTMTGKKNKSMRQIKKRMVE